MNDWHSTWLGRRSLLPRDLTGFEIEAFFNFSVRHDVRGSDTALDIANERLRSTEHPRALRTKKRPAAARGSAHGFGWHAGKA